MGVTIFVATTDDKEGVESAIVLDSVGHGTHLDDKVFATVDRYARLMTDDHVVYVNASRVRDGVVQERIIHGEELSTGGVVEKAADGVTVRFRSLVEGEPI